MPFRISWAEHFRGALTDIEITRGGVTGSVGSEVQGTGGEAGRMRKADVRTEKDIREYLEGWSDFEKAVYIATFRIPKGKVSTYGRIAEAIGRPRASREASRPRTPRCARESTTPTR